MNTHREFRLKQGPPAPSQNSFGLTIAAKTLMLM